MGAMSGQCIQLHDETEEDHFLIPQLLKPLKTKL